MASRRNFFYKKVTLSVDAFPNKPQVNFGFQATRVVIASDADARQVDFSFLKPNLDGELLATDGPLVFDQLGEGRLWFKQPEGKEVTVRVWAWRGAG